MTKIVYIVIDKEGVRVKVIGHNISGCCCVMSGKLSLVKSFKPDLVNNSLFSKFKAWCYNNQIVKVSCNEVTTYNRRSYCWLRNKGSGVVYKVYGLGNNISSNSKLLQGEKVMIKGIGVFKYSEFETFEF